jgi:hypothetical protein
VGAAVAPTARAGAAASEISELPIAADTWLGEPSAAPLPLPPDAPTARVLSAWVSAPGPPGPTAVPAPAAPPLPSGTLCAVWLCVVVCVVVCV